MVMTLYYCAERNGEYDVYKIPSNGGAEIRLTNTPGLDDRPEYLPTENIFISILCDPVLCRYGA